ncbi:transposase [Pseudomonas sp. Leaf48]|uniref:IS21 family transposase n=1 Tax=unclassified Pseudomonas TaxID=196821 RepID=UPI00072595DE|nr:MULTISPECIES: IS21 family transposase [unclassified Pseudomonas]KQN42149.1 transposase [Pseudomonas sp. Leaf48]MDR6925112.1 transposase [Pseudomonas sp. BE134]
MRLPIEKQREVLRLAEDNNLSNRAIGRLAKVSHNTVRTIRDQLKQSGETWENLRELDNKMLVTRLCSETKGAANRKACPLWLDVHEQLRLPDMTLELLWQEFREEEPFGVSYAQFTRLYRNWLSTQKVSMRQVHLPGDKMFVDFCGRTMPITDPLTGTVSFSQVFVAVLGASGYTFATAVASQTTQDWLRCHVRALEFFEGVPKFVVPDNLKAAVLKTTRDQIVLNRAYSELSEHYGITITPARPRKPKDKSLGEIGVQIVQRFVLARLRERTFFSLDELNEQITYWARALNDRVTKTYPKSRMVRFLEIESPALQPLPERAYNYSQWFYHIRVGSNYHVEFNEHHYSVPFHFANQIVDLRVNDEWLDVSFQRQIISTHRVEHSRGVSTLREHLPRNHKHFQDSQPEMLLAWAQSIGSETLFFAKKNLDDRRDFATGLRAVVALRRDVRKGQIEASRLESACAYANSLNILSTERLRSILRNGSDRRPVFKVSTPLIEHSNIRGAKYYSVQGDEPV